ncbi:vacuolar protein sorting-associated protein 41 homolog [Arachis hypogaea]|uniref:vacuolar protein sorting-associated protein 41 homolog n=1 Tax=Arachis hypogaea TaxID=3818 RepID=UPI000DEC58FF|nr:vacuolar protein sorting-associated protein 41 homolog [Arachis hypogaea]
MAPIPSENGVEGDDEREEEEEEEEEGDEEEDEEAEEGEEEDDEEEPRLKYQRMGGSIPALLSSDAASCIAVAERMIALGTHDGIVYILDFLGNQVKEFPAHSAVVNDLSFDLEGEYIGSCSDDGSVVICGLFSDEKTKFEYHRPMKAIALDPDYTRNASRRFVAGGLAGNLYLNSKTWLGYRDQVLHSGEGPIHAVKWRTSLVAWANNTGVKVYDTANNQRVTFIERPRDSPRPELLLPHLVWQSDTLLVIGWGTTVKIASIRTNRYQVANGTYRNFPLSSMSQVDIVASFQTSYLMITETINFISRIAPFDDALVVLAYVPGEDGEKDFSSTAPSRQGNAQRPEVRIVTWNNDELSTDALPVHGFEHYKPKDYSLAHAPFSGSSNAGGQWAAGDEPLYYIVSPKDVVIAKPRDTEDHITWLLQHGWHEKALAVVESSHGRSELLDEVGSRYLDHLIVERKYSEAASLCPKLLRGSASAWERWVFHFAHLRQLPVLVPYMPTENPRLRDSAYEVALNALATNPSFHKDLLSTIKSWPPVIYSALSVISAIEPQLKTSSMTEPLKEALAELYVINGQHEKAVALYADLMKPEVFDFIDKHKLHGAIREKVFQLMMIDCKRAVPLLIQAKNLISSPEVVKQLQNADNESDSRYFLHLYLHSLFEVNPHAGRDFHDMQDSLTALKEKLQRTVYRLTLVKGWNTEDIDAYYELISIGEPDFVEIKGVTYCGSSATSKLTMENVPWHAYVKAFSEALALKSQGEYEVACEHAHSCCVLLAKIKKFKIDGKWYTWIDYDKFHDLVASGRTFDSTDYMTATPSWAVYGAEEGGFDPEQSRYRKERRHHKSSRNQSG